MRFAPFVRSLLASVGRYVLQVWLRTVVGEGLLLNDAINLYGIRSLRREYNAFGRGSLSGLVRNWAGHAKGEAELRRQTAAHLLGTNPLSGRREAYKQLDEFELNTPQLPAIAGGDASGGAGPD